MPRRDICRAVRSPAGWAEVDHDGRHGRKRSPEALDLIEQSPFRTAGVTGASDVAPQPSLAATARIASRHGASNPRSRMRSVRASYTCHQWRWRRRERKASPPVWTVRHLPARRCCPAPGRGPFGIEAVLGKLDRKHVGEIVDPGRDTGAEQRGVVGPLVVQGDHVAGSPEELHEVWRCRMGRNGAPHRRDVAHRHHGCTSATVKPLGGIDPRGGFCSEATGCGAASPASGSWSRGRPICAVPA
jgi:hypothetical protein